MSAPVHDLIEHRIPLPGRELRIRAYASLDVLLASARDEDDLPFWAELWPSSRALAAWLWRRDLRGLRVLELGCGVGLAGIAAALRGARVVQTDYAAGALALARANALRNGCPDVSHRLADWRDFPPLGCFDLILGADILYEPRLHAHLRDVLDRHLAPGGRVVLADPGRLGAEAFVLSLERAGWRWELEELPAGDGNGSGDGPIDIFVLSRGLEGGEPVER